MAALSSISAQPLFYTLRFPPWIPHTFYVLKRDKSQVHQIQVPPILLNHKYLKSDPAQWQNQSTGSQIYIVNRQKSHPDQGQDEKYKNSYAGTRAEFTVLMIRAATLYGSAAELGRRSSRYPFQPFSTVTTGIRIEAPRSEIP